MSSLRDTQRAFLAAVLDGSAAAIAAELRDDGPPLEARLDVYRTNALEGFLATLQRGYGVIERLGGEQWFRQVGREYMRAHPSPGGDLHRVGERFPAFLHSRLQGTPYEYFGDVARLAWARQEVLDAAEPRAFDFAALARVGPETCERLVFRVNPAARLVASPYPILAIWRANQPDAADSEAIIRLDAGASRVLVIRRADYVELRELDAPAFAFAESCAAGRSFSEAAAAAIATDAAADLTDLLRRLVQLRLIVGFEE